MADYSPPPAVGSVPAPSANQAATGAASPSAPPTASADLAALVQAEVKKLEGSKTGQQVVGRVASILRQGAAIASVVVGVLPQVPLPNGARTALVAAGGALVTLEHWFSRSGV